MLMTYAVQLVLVMVSVWLQQGEVLGEEGGEVEVEGRKEGGGEKMGVGE